MEPADSLVYGAPVRAYWRAAEDAMTRDMALVLQLASAMDDRGAARQLITDCTNRMQDKAFADAGQLLNDVRWYDSKNSNTIKSGRNFETHEVLDELKPIPPMEVRLDAGEWDSLINSLLPEA